MHDYNKENIITQPNEVSNLESEKIYGKIDTLNQKIQDTYASILTVIEKHCLTKLELDSYKNECNSKIASVSTLVD